MCQVPVVSASRDAEAGGLYALGIWGQPGQYTGLLSQPIKQPNNKSINQPSNQMNSLTQAPSRLSLVLAPSSSR